MSTSLQFHADLLQGHWVQSKELWPHISPFSSFLPKSILAQHAAPNLQGIISQPLTNCKQQRANQSSEELANCKESKTAVQVPALLLANYQSHLKGTQTEKFHVFGIKGFGKWCQFSPYYFTLYFHSSNKQHLRKPRKAEYKFSSPYTVNFF